MTMQQPDHMPFEPPLYLHNAQLAGGILCAGPEAFRVDEVPLYAACGEGDHLYLRIQKIRLTTQEAIRRIAHAVGVQEQDIGRAGLKDKEAVTTQWLSVPVRCDHGGLQSLGNGLTVLEQTQHTNKLRPGHLLGNRFTMRFNGMEPEVARELLNGMSVDGIPNWFGVQRFGRGGQNFREAMEWLRAGGRSRGRDARFHAHFYPSVLQAEFFNRYIRLRLDVKHRALLGEYVRLANTGSWWQVDDVDAGTTRLLAGDLELTGPLPGGRLRPSRDSALQMESDVASELGWAERDVYALGRLVDGTRRDALLRPQEPVVTVDEGVTIVAFTLPAGSYATVVARELTGNPWFAPLYGVAGDHEPADDFSV
jgi:tRNA pseudouridine13 synthase